MNNIRIALIAHDGKKADMVSFVMKRIPFFTSKNVEVIATGTTGKHLIHAGLQKVRTMFSGPMGGDAQIASMIVNKEVDVVIFFIDFLFINLNYLDLWFKFLRNR